MRASIPLVLVVFAVASACNRDPATPSPTLPEGPGSVPTSVSAPSPVTTAAAASTTTAPPAAVTSTTTTTLPVPIVPDPEFVLRYAAPGPVDMRANPFAPADTGEYPEVFAARLFRLLPPTFTLIPELAAEDEPPSGFSDGDDWVVEVTLNSGLTWSDRELMDAHDVQFTFDALVQFGDPREHGWAVEDEGGDADLISVRALGEDVVEFRFASRPTIDRWHFGVATASILPQHYWQPVLAAAGEETTDPLLGLDAPSAGGYRLGGTANGEWTWTAVEDWWNSGAEYTVHDGGAVGYRNPFLGITETWGGAAEGPIVASWVEGPYAGSVVWFDALESGGAAFAVSQGRADFTVGGFAFGHSPRRDATWVISRSKHLYSLAYDPSHPALATAALRSGLPCFMFLDFLTGNVHQGSSIPSGWTPYEFSGWADDSRDDPCDVPVGERVAEGVRRMLDAGWTWDVPPSPDGDDEIQDGSGLRHSDGLSKRLTILAPPADFSPLAATTGLWLEGWLDSVGFDARVRTGLVSDASAPGWDIAVVISDAAVPPEPYLADSADFSFAYRSADTIAAASKAWQVDREALTDEVLAVPLYTPNYVDLFSPRVHFPYTRVLGGLDPALIATGTRRARYDGVPDCDTGTFSVLIDHPADPNGHRTPQDALTELLRGVQTGFGGIITTTGFDTASLVIGDREVVVATADEVVAGRGWLVTSYRGCAGFRPPSSDDP